MRKPQALQNTVSSAIDALQTDSIPSFAFTVLNEEGWYFWTWRSLVLIYTIYDLMILIMWEWYSSLLPACEHVLRDSGEGGAGAVPLLLPRPRHRLARRQPGRIWSETPISYLGIWVYVYFKDVCTKEHIQHPGSGVIATVRLLRQRKRARDG